ncbi:hypothetical protein QBC38DRAFT_204573 [Podospora fimiseda]|uniref:Uncharacterized protein n=1 Tax=Podospora fimiseda TaxID=252190 RepID=A0AAN7H812_9PEZI|nr:hypothetical protein QBC38DRAFT_204573 [Podospora fimiseda]
MMENESPTVAMHDDGKASKRGRLIGKIFGRDRDRERKGHSDDASSVNDFLHGPSDTLQVTHAAPPMLTKLDTKSVSRYPNANQVHRPSDPSQQDLTGRTHSNSPRTRANRKGLSVRFAVTEPEIMGEGGDECEDPTMEITKRRKPRIPQVGPVTSGSPVKSTDAFNTRTALQEAQASRGSFEAPTLRRTQTGFSPTPDDSEPPPAPPPRGTPTNTRLLGAPTAEHEEKRRSFIEIQQAQMRVAEGQAFAKAVRAASSERSRSEQSPSRNAPPTPPEHEPHSALTASPESIHVPQLQLPQPPKSPPSSGPPPIPGSRRPQGAHPSPIPSPMPSTPPETQRASPSKNILSPTLQQPNSPERFRKSPRLDQSPVILDSAASSTFQHPFSMSRQGSKITEREHGLVSSPLAGGGSSFGDVVTAAADDAMNTFVQRTRHLFELFRLHAESVTPLLKCTPPDLARAALWWFLTGRSALENAVRERPTTPESQRKNEINKQQAYTDLAKGYWLLEEVMPDLVNSGRSPTDREVEDVRAMLTSSLRKLAVSMKRNGFLPPEEAYLPQILDRTIWVEYPKLPQDLRLMLWGSSSLSITNSERATSGMSILETMPLGDSPSAFCFGRFKVDVFLMEQGAGSQQIHLPCFLSIVRPQNQADILFVTSSQNGDVQLRISQNKITGPTWEDVRWRAEKFILEVRLPRGFGLIIQCSQQAYSTLRSMYEFSNKLHSTLYPRQDENCLFKSTLRSFQYFDGDQQARAFPKEPVANCEIAVFERLLREGAATGPRTYHRGYRIAVVTGPRTKTLSGINQTYSPQTPIQFAFMRNDGKEGTLALKFDNGRLKGNMSMTFTDEKDALRLHSLISGTMVGRDEEVSCSVPVAGLWFSERYGNTQDKGLVLLSSMGWNKARVINSDGDGDRPSCVLSDKLRIVYECKEGTLTDRINVAPGEFKLRLDVQNPNCMMLFRQPQVDATLVVGGANMPRDPAGLTHALNVLQQASTIRTFSFSKLEDLHKFETAVTGFDVLFDGIASTFAIARRRMVVPIHKKWEAGATRIQVVQQDGVAQILAFFEDFSHGKSMGFNLKGTDVYESFGKAGKAGLKLVDAKFPLPKTLPADQDGAQAAADSAFLCLDLPELPGEHDDISIIFESEAERDRLITCLPAPVKGGSRLPNLKLKGMSKDKDKE